MDNFDPPEAITNIFQVLALPDPAERAKRLGAAAAAVPAFQAWLRTARQAAIVEMKKTGKTWDQIGEELNMHPQRASQIARGVAGGTKKRGEG